MNRLHIAASLLALTLFSACGSNQNPKTHDFLVQVVQNIHQMDAELAQQSPPKPPALLSLPPLPKDATDEQRDERLEVERRYQGELLKYFPALAKSVDQVSSICDRAQSKAGSIDTTGADPAATDLASKYQSLIDHRQQLAVQMAGLVAQEQNEVGAGRISDFGLRLVAAGTEALFSPSDANLVTAADDLQPKANEKNQGGREFAGIQRAILDWRRDATETKAAQAELLKTLQANYPKQDWSFLQARF